MPMLPARDYVSEHTQFIKKLMQEKPDLPEKQREGRDIWWDKTPNELSDRQRMDEGRVAQAASVYGGLD